MENSVLEIDEMKQLKEIPAQKCITCGRYTFVKNKICPNCLQYGRKSNLIKTTLYEGAEINE